MERGWADGPWVDDTWADGPYVDDPWADDPYKTKRIGNINRWAMFTHSAMERML